MMVFLSHCTWGREHTAGLAMMTSWLHRFLGDAGRNKRFGLPPGVPHSSSRGDKVGGPLKEEDVSSEGVSHVDTKLKYRRRENTLAAAIQG